MPAAPCWTATAAAAMPLMLSELLPPGSRQHALPISVSLAKSNPAHLPFRPQGTFPHPSTLPTVAQEQFEWAPETEA